MSVSDSGQVLGASTAIGGWATLPYTAGNDILYFMNIFIIATGILVFLSYFISRILLIRRQS